MANLCGIYIGAEALSLLVLKPAKKGWQVEAGGMELHGAGEEGDLGPAAKALAKSLKVSGGPISVSLPKQQAILRSILLPSVDRDELVQMARFEAERHIPFHAERHCTGYHIMRSLGVEGSEVVLAAADGPVVQRALAGVQSAGFTTRAIDLSSVALVNSFLYENQEGTKGKTVAVLVLGLDSLDLVLLSDGRLVFARSATMDLRGILEAYIGYLPGEGAARPEPAKLALAARMIDCQNLEGHYGSAGAVPEPANAALVRTWIDRVIQELRRTYDFARREMKCPPIEQVAITGEGALLRNLDQYLGINLDLAVRIINPVAALPGAAEHKFPFEGLEFVIPFGAAIGGSMEGAFKLDLTPAEHYRQRERRRILRQLVFTAVILLITLGLGAYTLMQRSEINRQRQQAYDVVNKTMKPYVTEVAEMRTKLKIITEFLNDENSALAVLNGIAGAKEIPAQVTLRSIEYTKGEEAVIDGDARGIPDITDFIYDLNRSGKFTEVHRRGDPTPNQLYGQAKYDFTLECIMAPQEAESAKGRSRR